MTIGVSIDIVPHDVPVANAIEAAVMKMTSVTAERYGLTLTEAIVPEDARIAGRTARSLRLLYQHSVTLLGVSRNGQRFSDRVRLLTIRPGDVLLLLGTPERVAAAATWIGVLPLEGR